MTPATSLQSAGNNGEGILVGNHFCLKEMYTLGLNKDHRKDSLLEMEVLKTPGNKIIQ